MFEKPELLKQLLNPLPLRFTVLASHKPELKISYA
ncbi:hypothetical protein DESC_830071 [Desulfosarcina cetonica]|nr:hypothetical protein DESC_830071 [Desulfosarcina cetonica]